MRRVRGGRNHEPSRGVYLYGVSHVGNGFMYVQGGAKAGVQL